MEQSSSRPEFDQTDPRTWSSTTRRLVGDALRRGVAHLSKAARHSLSDRGILVKVADEGLEQLLPAAADGYKRWLKIQQNE